MKYLAAFVIDRYIVSAGGGNDGDGLWGYFTSISSDGKVIGTGSGSGGGTLQKLALVK